MFGTYRFILALMVVNGHLFRPWYPAGFAVYSFFILSGYLMTLIMNRRYGYNIRGFSLYALNRFLRIYPPYFTGLLISVLILLFVPAEDIQAVDSHIQWPSTFGEWTKNLLIFGLDRNESCRMVPQAWALHIELAYYAAIGLFLGRSRRVATAWLIFSCLWTAWMFWSGRSAFYWWYGFLPSASIPFSLGSCLYHYREGIQRVLVRFNWPRALTATLVVSCLPLALPWDSHSSSLFDHGKLPFFLNMAVSAALIAVLMNPPRRTFTRFREIDSFFGDLSYPVYLFHWQAAVLAAYLFRLPGSPSPQLVITGGILALLLAIAEARLLSRNLERLRSRVKRRLASSGS